MDSGLSFEKRVEKLYLDIGKNNVQHNVIVRFGNVKSQFDVVFGTRKKYYVECKFRSSNYVPFSEVAAFGAKLLVHNISSHRGIFISNTYFDKRTLLYAQKTGLHLIDGKKLSFLEKLSPLPFSSYLF